MAMKKVCDHLYIPITNQPCNSGKSNFHRLPVQIQPACDILGDTRRDNLSILKDDF